MDERSPPVTIDANLLKALSSCNNVKFQVFGTGQRLLQLVPTQDTITSGNHLDTWNGRLMIQQVSTIGFPKLEHLPCTCHTLTLSDIDELDYYDNGCQTLHVPAKSDGRILNIRRNGGEGFTVNQQEYEQYIGLNARYTSDPEMILRTPDGLRINYERYYAKLVGPENYDIEFRISQNGIIVKGEVGIPLVSQVIRDFKFARYEYHFDSFRTLEKEVTQIRKVIGRAILKLVELEIYHADDW